MHTDRRLTMMRYAMIGFLFFFMSMGPTLARAGEEAAKKPEAQKGKPGLMQRIDFGSSYIMGQSIKSGAVYLLHRKQSDINSMISIRTNYRKEIMEEYDMPTAEATEKNADAGKRGVAPAGFKTSMLDDRADATKK